MYTSVDPITKARNTIFASFRAETVTYTDKDGLESDIEAIIDREGNMDPEIRGVSDEIEAIATMLVRVSDVPDPRARKDTVVIKKPLDDGTSPDNPEEEETWEVREVLNGDGGMWELGLRRDARVTY